MVASVENQIYSIRVYLAFEKAGLGPDKVILFSY